MNACKKMRRTDLEAKNKRDDDDVEGVLASLSVLSSISALSPLFFIVVRLLSFISASSSLSLLVLAPLFHPVLQILFVEMEQRLKGSPYLL